MDASQTSLGFMYRCDNTSEQSWSIQIDGSLKNAKTAACLAVDSNSAISLSTARCGSGELRAEFTSEIVEQIRLKNGNAVVGCLSGENGRISIRACNDSPSTRWLRPMSQEQAGGYTFKNSASNQCLDALVDNSGFMHPCDQNSEQVWSLTVDGLLKNARFLQCLVGENEPLLQKNKTPSA